MGRNVRRESRHCEERFPATTQSKLHCVVVQRNLGCFASLAMTIDLLFFIARRELNEFFEAGGVLNGYFCKGLAVQIDFGALQSGDKFGIRDSIHTASRIDADRPQTPELALALLAVARGKNHGAHDGFFCGAVKFPPAAKKTFGAF